VSKSILRHMHITDWQLRCPEVLPHAPSALRSKAGPVCWVVGDLPGWIGDLCLVLHLADYQHVLQPADLPVSLDEGDWILWSGESVTPENYPHVHQLSLSSSASAKQQLWHQICQYEN